MVRRLALFIMVVVGITMVPAVAEASRSDPDFTAGAAGIGDPYFPEDGNGGYDVAHYHLAVTYDPGTGGLVGVADIEATATQNLSRFNLDLKGLNGPIRHGRGGLTEDPGIPASRPPGSGRRMN